MNTKDSNFIKNKNENEYVYVLNETGVPLMPTRNKGKVRKLLEEKKTRIVEYKPFTIQLLYETTNFRPQLMGGDDPGRTNNALDVVNEETCHVLFKVEVSTRNKEIPKLMRERKEHRNASRSGKRKVRQRLAYKNGTFFKIKENNLNKNNSNDKNVPQKRKGFKHNDDIVKERYLPHYEKPIKVKFIKNKEVRFCNRKREKGWLTPTARHLLETKINIIKMVKKYIPMDDFCIELNKFNLLTLQEWKILILKIGNTN